MKKTYKGLFITAMVLMFLLLQNVVAADGNIENNYFFDKESGDPLTDVDMEIYTCTDVNEQCVTVQLPAWLKKNSGSNNYIKDVEYPGTAQPTDYAEYFFKDCFAPLKAVVPNDFGSGLTFNYDNNFNKVENCFSPIQDFSMVNTAYANEPIQINVDAKLDAETYSAFKGTDAPPRFLPTGDAYVDQYAAETKVTLRIYDPQDRVVFEDSRNLNLLFDTSQRVSFIWTPKEDEFGNGFKAVIQTDVTDCQCKNALPDAAQLIFEVLPTRPTGECYTLLNDLQTNISFPQTGEEVTASYTKISNHANDVVTPVPMIAVYQVRKGFNDPEGPLVFEQMNEISATSATEPSLQSFVFIPQDKGYHTIFVTWRAQSPLCDGLNNPVVQNSLVILVQGQDLFDIAFRVVDRAHVLPIEGAIVAIGEKSAVTNEEGIAVLTDFAIGDYTYTVTHPLYVPRSADIQIDSDAHVEVQMTKKNVVPVIATIPDISFPEDTSYNLLDLDDYGSDEDHPDAQLTWSMIPNTVENIAVSIDPVTHQVTFVPDPDFNSEIGGERTIQFKVEDPDGASAVSNEIGVRVTTTNDAPSIENLPDITTNEDTQVLQAFNVKDFAVDRETPQASLLYTLSVDNENKCGVSLDQFGFIHVNPSLDFYGECNAKVIVSDQELTDEDTFTVTVISVNDLPVFSELPNIITNEDQNVISAFDLDQYIADVETPDDRIQFSVDSQSNPSLGNCVINTDHTVSCSVVRDQKGDSRINIKAEDQDNGVAFQSFTFIVQSMNDAPEIISEPVRVAFEQARYAYDVDARDSDGDQLQYALSFAPEGMQIDADSGVISWIPRFDQIGNHIISVQVSDGELVDEQIYELSVLFNQMANHAPVLNDLADKTVFEGEFVKIIPSAFDPDEDSLSFSFSAPLNESGEWQTDFDDAGVYTITVTVSDGRGGFDSHDFVLTVLDKVRQCQDGLDNDGDGAVDYPADFSCSDMFDDDEEFPKAQCQDNEDNDGDSLIDGNDPGCGNNQDNDEFNVVELEIASLVCEPRILVNDIQACSVFVKANNAPVGGAKVDLFYLDSLEPFGEGCTTDLISGGCVITDVQEMLGNRTVFATAAKDGFSPDNDKLPQYTYQVWEHQYDIINLKVFNDPGFETEDDEFFRGEDLFVSFQVVDLNNNNALVNDVVTAATLISQPGGRANLSEINGPQSNFYYYALRPIPLTHDFKGFSQVFTFAFNFEDQTMGQKEVALSILNNPPEIVGGIQDISFNSDEVFTLDLTSFEDDLEDGPAGNANNLDWSVSNVDPSLLQASIDQNDVLTIIPLRVGSDSITLTVSDLDGSVLNDPSGFVSQEIIVRVQERLADCNDHIDNDGDGAVDYPADFGCESSEDDDERNNGTTECSDGIDNDGDGLIDQVDPGCENRDDGSENQAPVLNAIGNRQVQEGQTLQFMVSATDPENHALQFSATNLPNGAAFNEQTQAFTWTPSFTQAGVYNNMVFSVSDSDLSDSETISVTVVESENHNPEILSSCPPEAVKGELYAYTIEVRDLDNDPITLTLRGQPSGMVLNGNTISWIPAQDQVRLFSFDINAQDAFGSSDKETCAVEVRFNANQAPVIVSKPITAFVEETGDMFNSLYKYDVDAIDPDHDELTYFLLEGPEGMTINSKSGLIEWKPSRRQLGKTFVKVQVSDGALADEQEFYVTVSLPERIANPRRALFIDSIEFLEKDPFDLQPGDDVMIAVTFRNLDSFDLKEVKMTAAVNDLDTRRIIGPFTIPKRKETTKLVTIHIPDDAEPGEYDLQIYAQDNKQVKRYVYRELVIN